MELHDRSQRRRDDARLEHEWKSTQLLRRGEEFRNFCGAYAGRVDAITTPHVRVAWDAWVSCPNAAICDMGANVDHEVKQRSSPNPIVDLVP